MLSIKPLKSAKAACDYYMTAFNYYQGDSEATAWFGQGKEHLKLGDEVDQTTMLNLLQGILPDGTRIQSSRGEHRPGFDMTFSAPKSVSILVGLDIVPELVKYHDNAVKYALSEIESEFTEARFVRDGEINYKKTGNLISATFRQPSSRANDPALHTHCVTMNLTFCDGQAKSLASDRLRIHGVVEQIQNNAHYCGLLYRHHLANSLKEAGFSLRMTGDGLFEIDGVPEEVLREFSKRRESIEELMDEKGWDGAKAASHAALLTRQNKEEHNIEKLKNNWKERALTLGFDDQVFMQNLLHGHGSQDSIWQSLKDRFKSVFDKDQKTPNEGEIANICVQVAIETLSQRTSVFTERALKAQSLKHSLIYPNKVSEKAISAAILHEVKSNQLYKSCCADTNQTLMTTPWLLTMEAESLARIEQNKGKVSAISTKQEVSALQKQIDNEREYPLTGSQKEAMNMILTSHDRYLAVQGYAGVAKTTMLKEAKVLIENKGYTLRGVTVASSAAEELRTKSGIPADVFPIVHQELKNASKNSLSKTIIIVDEASMLSSPQGHELIKLVEYTKARLILVGDTAQLPTVNNGRVFGLTQEYGIQTTIMDEIVRQKNEKARASVVHATKGEVKESIENLHHVEELASHHERIEWIASYWLSQNQERQKQTLLFAPTHKDRAEITTIIRQGLENSGVLKGEAHVQKILKAKALEAVQLRFSSYYQAGDVIRCNQNLQRNKLKQGHYYTVDTMNSRHYRDNMLPLVDEKGQKHLFQLKHLPQYKTHTAAFERVIEVYQSHRLDLKEGDQVLWNRNFKDQTIRNGQRAVIHAIEKDKIVFNLDDGQEKTILKDNPAMKHLDHGYVLTNYKVQGKDAAFAVGLMGSHHRFSATLKNFYVQISRAVHEMTLVTDDKEALIAAIQRNKDEKPAALDIVSSERLKAHEHQFQSKQTVSFKSIIDKQKQFEDKAVLRTSAIPAKDIDYISKTTLPNKIKGDFERVKELER